MTSRTLPRFVSTLATNSARLVADRVVATCADQTTNRRAAFAVMMDHRGGVWIDKPSAAIPAELVCTVTAESEAEWLAEELAEELLRRPIRG
jgi:putative intracellular protease/amidase